MSKANLTTEQTNHELARIRRGALTLNEYIRLSYRNSL